MKFLNFLFAFLLVAAFTSCDTTKKVTSTTPSSTSTSASNTANAKQAPSKPKVKKPKSTMTKPTKPKMDTDEVATPDQPKVDMKSSTVKPSKTTSTDITKPGKTDILDTPGSITWEAANDRYSAEGTFKNWRMTDVKMVGDDLNTLTAKLEIDLTSIWEKSPKLTDHLKADDYFGVEEHQLATIEVKRVFKGKEKHTAIMWLTMRGKEQKLTGNFEVVSMKPMRIKGETMVDRSVFGIGVDNTSVPNEIKVMFDTVIPR